MAAFFSFVSLYYYLIVIREMYVGEAEEKTRFPTPWLEYAALTLLIGRRLPDRPLPEASP